MSFVKVISESLEEFAAFVATGHTPPRTMSNIKMMHALFDFSIMA
tara:strand:+ start:5542 stop:5676 length:135 start_codon:yes stop_codon:yes gene_type:complete